MIYILLPFLYSYFRTPKNAIWVPINHQNKLPGDNRIYAAGVRSALDSFIKYKHPCSDSIGPMAIDLTRYVSYRIAAILTLGIKDLRYAYLVSFTLSVLIQYVFIYLILNILMSEGLFSVVITLIVLLFYNHVYDILRYPIHVKNNLRYYLNTFSGRSVNEYLFYNNDLLRYVVLSVSGIYVWISFLIVLLVHPSEALIQYTLYMIFISISSLLVYPSIFFFSSVILFINILPIILNNIYISIYYIGSILLVILSIILLYNHKFLSIIQSFKEIIAIHASVSKDFNFGRNESIFMLLNLFLLLYIISNPLHPYSSIFIFFIISTFFILATYKYVFFERFFIRGGKHIYIFLLFTTIHFSILFYIPNMIEILYVISLLVIIIIIVNTSKNYSELLFHKRAFYLTSEEWDIIQYVQSKMKDENVITFDGVMFQLLPVYTQTNLIIRGAEWLENPLSELEKFIGYAKKIFRSPDLSNYFKSYFEDDYNAKNNIKVLIDSLLYPDYQKNINGEDIFNNDKNGWSQTFITYVEDNEDNEDNSIIECEKYFIITDKNSTYFDSNTITFRKVYENKRYIIFKK